jgi:antitoxin component YwqK of YwqJK toxin-antitoxin module
MLTFKYHLKSMNRIIINLLLLFLFLNKICYSQRIDTVYIDSNQFSVYYQIKNSKYFYKDVYNLNEKKNPSKFYSCKIYKLLDTVEVLDGFLNLYSDGEVVEISNYKNGKLNGFKYNFIDNKLNEISSYKNDTLEGPIKSFYYNSGQIREEYSYKNGVIDGKYLFYYQNGQIGASGTFTNSQKTGFWTYYFENGIVKSEGVHKDLIVLEYDRLVSDFKIQFAVSLDQTKYEKLITKLKDYYFKEFNQKTLNYYGKIGKWKYYSEDGKLLKKENYSSTNCSPFVLF